MGRLFQLLWGRGGNFQELGHHPLFGLGTTCGCVIYLAGVLQRAYTEAQGLMEVHWSIMGLFGSNQFMSHIRTMLFF